jgi:hypothetical protein
MPEIIICPSCRAEIEVSEALSAPLRDQLRKQFDSEQRKREKEYADRDSQLQQREDDLQAKETNLDLEIKARLVAAKERMQYDAEQKAREEMAVELHDKQAELEGIRDKLKKAQDAELDLRKKTRSLEDEKREFELTVNRRLDEEREKIREAAKKEAADDRAFKDAEKDKLITDLRHQIDDLQRKSEQGSQQLQGEVMELSLEDLLGHSFPHDRIIPVPKGVHGGDLVQEVHDTGGRLCGNILWESKRTKAWSDGWLPKFRDDQRVAKAQIGVLVSLELPRDVTGFGCVEGVWISNWPSAINLAHALRTGLVEVARAKQAMEGQQGKMELLYNYLSGSEFQHRVEGIVEAFRTMKEDLEAEKRALLKIWAKREKQLERAVVNTAGMYGDLNGIIGGNLPQIERLELSALPGPDEDSTASAEAV